MDSLFKKTLKLLKESPVPIRQISAEAGVPADWLMSVKYSRIKNPSVNRIQKLYEYLSDSKLSV